MRSMLLLLAGLMAMTGPLSAEAAAPTEEAAELEKDTVDYHKDRYKAVEKLAGQLAKEIDKEKDTKDTIQELKAYYKEELARLREKGVPTVEDDTPVHPQHADYYESLPEEDRTKLVALRDMMVELKGMDVSERPKPYQNKLAEYVTILKDRYERKQKSLDEASDK